MDDIQLELTALINEMFPEIDTTSVTGQTRLLEALGLNSLSMMLLAISIEDRFGISISEDFTPGTVGELCAYIRDARA